jgi:hypothetical protein
VDDERTAIGEPEFDSLAEAETYAGRLKEVRKGFDERVLSDWGYRITEVVEQRQFGGESSCRAA